MAFHFKITLMFQWLALSNVTGLCFVAKCSLFSNLLKVRKSSLRKYIKLESLAYGNIEWAPWCFVDGLWTRRLPLDACRVWVEQRRRPHCRNNGGLVFNSNSNFHWLYRDHIRLSGRFPLEWEKETKVPSFNECISQQNILIRISRHS
jgi:hypothetical protein